MTFVVCVSALFLAGIAAQDKVSRRTEAKPSAQSAEISAGEKVYVQQCDACHFPHSAAKKIGPGLKGIYRKAKFADGKAVSDATMIGWVKNGGKNMPPLAKNLNADEMRELIAYLHTL